MKDLPSSVEIADHQFDVLDFLCNLQCLGRPRGTRAESWSSGEVLQTNVDTKQALRKQSRAMQMQENAQAKDMQVPLSTEKDFIICIASPVCKQDGMWRAYECLPCQPKLQPLNRPTSIHLLAENRVQ